MVARGAVVIGYQYVSLRLVPRVDREEFINVGVVLYAQDAGFLEAAWEIDAARAAALCPTCDLDGVRAMLEQIRAVCRGEPGRGRPVFERAGQRFGWIIAPRSTVVQPGPVHGGLCADPTIELERLLVRLVRA
ncbi:hypothetical protein BA895_15225 [Humibacillus sp. DSM 29435]|uniref:DUF3037 domain-containing protein n=1 Tax=Humibacillus sp. DSM 29435 TaxID=1869167 RepID=UPI000873182B|nr:DUF3037 domain-containing protein [Humibacillus sp. DSM 29435]OFE17597.1 hypothetical protein BA895_15225 [Humibacillus sp. DSM 29435]